MSLSGVKVEAVPSTPRNFSWCRCVTKTDEWLKSPVFMGNFRRERRDNFWSKGRGRTLQDTNETGTFISSTTGLSPMNTLRTVRHPIFVPPKHFGLLLRLQLEDDLSSLIAGAQTAKPFHSKGMIKKTLHPAQLVPHSARIYKGRQ
jgi:hypothetical protein